MLYSGSLVSVISMLSGATLYSSLILGATVACFFGFLGLSLVIGLKTLDLIKWLLGSSVTIVGHEVFSKNCSSAIQ